MNKLFKIGGNKKKVGIRDVVSPQPSKHAKRAVNGALNRARADQESIAKAAQKLRTSYQ
ncbi:hypothetical protein H7Y63_02820 [Polaromonas sp.]|nr:hypothetical protein [Candidatus Saccharibacteria bacterium]